MCVALNIGIDGVTFIKLDCVVCNVQEQFVINLLHIGIPEFYDRLWKWFVFMLLDYLLHVYCIFVNSYVIFRVKDVFKIELIWKYWFFGRIAAGWYVNS